MSTADRPTKSLPPDACRDEETLRRFVQSNISVNAWPIHAHSLRRLIHRSGVDLDAAQAFSMSLYEMEVMLDCVYKRSRRAERMLNIENAFHTSLHNVEVLLRLLVLEWPRETPIPDSVRQAPLQVYSSFEAIRPVVLRVIEALATHGVSGSVIARDVLAALGHDFGHSGGTDRTDKDGLPSILTHEETAEKHIAKVGVDLGFPAALVLESMAGIRATTFYSRAGRERIAPANEFEKRLTLADVMGCVLPPDQWLTHVGVPVLKEKIPSWKRRMNEIAGELRALREREVELPENDPEFAQINEAKAALVAEDGRIIRDLEEWFRSERGFFLFVDRYKLEAVTGARELWGQIIKEKIALVEGVLARRELLVPLVKRGFPFLEEYAHAFANVGSLGERIHGDDIDPNLRELLLPFVTTEQLKVQ